MPNEAKKTSAREVALRRAFSHPKRLEVFSYLTRKKGCTEAGLAGAHDLTLACVRYHLRVLQSADLVAHVEDADHGTAGRYIAVAICP